ncbi:hypothetical protein [Niallia sp. 03133]|uniref:hypothetical protein n=1 Tax=Niallia sp. 03133 TaxID=3458060 RepID=UPI004043C9C9
MHEEAVESAIIRCGEEFKLLFPEGKITTTVIYEWCKVIYSKRKIRRVLEKYFKKVGTNWGSYYE